MVSIRPNVHASHVGGNVNSNVEETSEVKRLLCAKYLSDMVVCLRQKHTCVTLPRKTSAGEALERACLRTFDTGGTTRRSVPKLFTCLRTDRRLGEYREAFQNPSTPHRQLRL